MQTTYHCPSVKQVYNLHDAKVQLKNYEHSSSSITVQLTSVTCYVFRPSDVCEVDYYTLIKDHCTVNGSHGYPIVYTLYGTLIIGVPSKDWNKERESHIIYLFLVAVDFASPSLL